MYIIKNFLKILYLTALFASVATWAGCGGALQSGNGTTPTNVSNLNDLEGSTDVPVGNLFKYSFSQAISTATVNVTTFFMVQNPTSNPASTFKAAYDNTICNTDNRIDASVSCESNLECLLDPASDLSHSTTYTACLSPSIEYADASSWSLIRSAFAQGNFPGESISFTTEAGAPSIVWLKDTAGNNIETTGTTGVFPTAFEIKFSDPMDVDTLIAEGNITVLCEDFPELGISEVTSEGQNVYTLTFEVSELMWIAALRECVLTVSSNVTNASGTPLAADAVYTFTTGCALNDDFNADSQSCWNVVPDGTLNTWGELIKTASNPSGVFVFNTSNSTLDFSNSAAFLGGIYKKVSIDPSGFEMIVTFYNSSGFEPGEAIGLSLTYQPSVSTQSFLTFGISGDGAGNLRCVAYWDGGAGLKMATHDCSGYGEPSVRVAATLTGFALEQTDGSDYRPFGNFNPDDFPSSSTEILDRFNYTTYIMLMANVQADPATAEIHRVRFEGISTEDQY